MQEEIATASQTQSAQFVQILNAKSEQVKNILEKFATCIQNCLQKAGQADLSSKINKFLDIWVSC